MDLTITDYTNILQFYNKPIPTKSKDLKRSAEKIMATKLCRCIKKLDPYHESKSIGICTKSIFNTKGYVRGKFNCKKGSHVTIKKRNSLQSRRPKNNTQKNTKPKSPTKRAVVTQLLR